MTVRSAPALTVLAIAALLGCSSTGSKPGAQGSSASGGGGSGGASSGAAGSGATSSGGATSCVFASSGTSTGGAPAGGVASAGSDSGGVPMGGAPLGSGMVPGPVSTRCQGRAPYKVNPNGCFLQIEPPEFSNGGSAGSELPSGGAGSELPSGGAGGVTDCNFAHDAGYGDPLYNDSGDDDECKYHMSWTSTPIQKNQPFTVMVKATNLQTGAPLANLPDQEPGTVALSRIEPFVPCDPVHLPPTSTLEGQHVTETGPGEFSVGPLVFDESARWEMRFHFYGDCFNNSATPHAHIAFFVDVP